RQTTLVTFGEGDVEPPGGAHGGKPGSLNKIDLTYPDGTVYRTTTKDMVTDVPEGTVYDQDAGGGGGYGDPRLRPAALVAREVRNGIISCEVAERDYGVIIDPETFKIDEERTAELRGKQA
ncbi:hydantoinase B/oxoprolinase family protein, partial [Acidobacteriota bacterium]